jgi:hypothetical protein
MNNSNINNLKSIYFETEFVNQKDGFTRIPVGYIDKTICGCGVTSIALENNLNTIIAVPHKYLVDNKVNQYPNSRYKGKIFGVYGGVSKDEINEYLDSTEIIKIMVTYDSLNKVEHLLNKCVLIIDESDQLLKGIKLKTGNKDLDVYSYLMKLAEQHKDRVSFISATPLPLKYLPLWVSDLPQYKFYFSNTVKVKPYLMKRRYPYKSLADEIIRPLNHAESITIGNKTFKKVIVFINSVENILKVVKECLLNKDEVTILCGDNTRNDYKIRGYKRLENFNQLTKFTFITSSGFAGIDLWDETAINIVVSNTTKEHQMLNLLTDLKQATSRQRNKNNPNYNTFIYLYNQNNFEKTEKELIEIIDNNRKQITDNCKLLNELKEKKDSRYNSTLKTFKDSLLFKNYSLQDNGKHFINDLAFSADEYFILETRKQFQKGFNVMGCFDNEPLIIDAPKIVSPFSYATLLEKYKESLKDETVTFTDEEKATENYQVIDLYYRQNKTFTNNSSYAKKMLKANGNDWLKIYLELHNMIMVSLYEWKQLKLLVEGVYKKYGINRKPKETDLQEFNFEY